VREQPEQQAPPVQRLRVRYAKRGRMRFTSHRDFSRAFERAVLRARVPVAYSSGFNPHPRISYAGASPTGAASEAEYLELALAEVVEPAAIRARLDEVMPVGLDIVDVVESPGGALADVLQASRWLIEIPVDPARATGAVAAFLAAESVRVERMTKRGMREFDCRAAVLALTVEPAAEAGAAAARLALTLRHVEPAVRPDDVMSGLRTVGGLDLGTAAPLLTRLEQGPLDEATGTVGDPLRPTSTGFVR
jgi:radical SAM-linked protein